MKNLKELLSEVGNPRAPVDKKQVKDAHILNKHLMVNPKTVAPTLSQDHIFNGDIPGKETNAGKFGNKNVDDHAQGFTPPIIFGDYVNHFMNMKSESAVDMLSDYVLKLYENFMSMDLEAIIEGDDQLDEVSKGMLRKYIGKAAEDLRDNSETYGHMLHKHKDDHDDYADHTMDSFERKSDNRIKGIKMAAKKLHRGTNEEVEQIDELSKGLLRRYISKAARDRDIKQRGADEKMARAKSNFLNGKPSAKDHDDSARDEIAANKRRNGIELAVKKFHREDVQAESFFRKPRTKAELTANDGADVALRAKRKNLPTDWDDKPKTNKKDRNWKSFRKTQYKEEVEQIDELSSKTLSSYAQKNVHHQVQMGRERGEKGLGVQRHSGRKGENRSQGFDRAVDKLHARSSHPEKDAIKRHLKHGDSHDEFAGRNASVRANIHGAESRFPENSVRGRTSGAHNAETTKRTAGRLVRRLAREDVEQIDELSRNTVNQYINKSADSYDKAYDKDETTMAKRIKGIKTAAGKMGFKSAPFRNLKAKVHATEGVEQINELSPGLLGRYVAKSSTERMVHKSEADKAASDAHQKYRRGEDATSERTKAAIHSDKALKRSFGVEKAASRLRKESLNEEFKIGQMVHAGLAVKGGAGFVGRVHKVDGDMVHVHVSTSKYGDRVVKAHKSKVSRV